MKNKIFLLLTCLFFALNASSQVIISEESSIQDALNKYVTLNKQQSTIKAWRIQVVTTNDRREMEAAIVKLGHKYPALKYHWKHASPYYQLKVGAYEEKADLQNMLITLKRDFPSAIPVMDNMEKSELVN